MGADPVREVGAQALDHLRVHMGEVQHILNAVLPILRVEWPSFEKFSVALLPELMEPVLVQVDAVGSVVLLEDFVQSGRLDVADSLQSLVLLFLVFVHLQLAPVGLDCARVEDVDDAGVHDLVQDQSVVAAVVEDLEHSVVAHHIPQDLLGQLEGFHLALQQHAVDVDQEGVDAVVELDHFDEAVLPQSAFQVDSQNLAVQNRRCASQQTLEVVDIQGLLGRDLCVFHLEEVQHELLLGVSLLESTLTH